MGIKYKLAFHGRKKSALGVSSFHVVEVVADNISEARHKVYETHEHIHGGMDGIRVVNWTYEVESTK